MGTAQRSRRVLVVDDDLDTAESLALLLRDMGHKVEFAISARAALDVARRFRPEIVFLDLGLPDMDGYELGKQLKAEGAQRGTRILVLTGRSHERDRHLTFEAGFDAHLVKPIDSASLEGLLR
jgi:DNA-binding response OmpR family regulator